MAAREPQVAGQQQVTLRHVGPAAAVWPDAPASVKQFTVLACTSMVARPLPSSPLPSSPDFVSGSWSLRLGDAGECSLTFPNANASDGVPWKSRFDTAGHLQWIEVYEGGELEFVGVIDDVQRTPQQIVVHCYDGFWLLKKAYVRDWTVTQSPRDVIARGTALWVPVVADDFPAGSSLAPWVYAHQPSGTSATVLPAGGLALAGPLGQQQFVQITDGGTVAATATWRATLSVDYAALAAGAIAQFFVTESDGTAYGIEFGKGGAQFQLGAGTTYASLPFQPGRAYEIVLESTSAWVSCFVNGVLIGQARRKSAATTSVSVMIGALIGGPVDVIVRGVMCETAQPFLQRGADEGDYVLPGDQTTLPPGGLHARYSNNADLAGNANALSLLGAPSRSVAWGSQIEYVNQQDSQIDAQASPADDTTGTAVTPTYWSCVWFGAIWLPLSQGNFGFNLACPANTAARVWVGQTQLGQQLVDEWAWSSAASNFPFTVNAATLAGTLSYGAGTVQRDGWYPLRVEYAVNSASAVAAPVLTLTSSPVTFTPPGGAPAIASGAQSTVVPSTMLSPLGCADQRYQGTAHFDLVQQTLQAFDYQAALEPAQLESGLFPGTLAPRIREGHDTAIVLEPDRGPRHDGQGILNYSATVNTDDFATSLQGNGAGASNDPSGVASQALVYDPGQMLAALFDVQQWQDFPDASFTELLQALLNSQLALQMWPWQVLSADPYGRPGRAFTWPLPGSIAAMRWRPGDGLRIRAVDINVDDVSPRQMLVVTRNVTPTGLTGTQATFAARPTNGS